jgi:two-component system nitrogen regulation sensor histidine kinase NtrY
LNRLRNRLVIIFLAATLVPLGATLWITTALLDKSLGLASTRELDELSKSLEATGRALYQQTRESMKLQETAGRLAPAHFRFSERRNWPTTLEDFTDSGDKEQFVIAGDGGDQLQHMVRRSGEILVYTQPLGGMAMNRLSGQLAATKAILEQAQAHDLRKGFLYTLISLAAATWLIAILALIYSAHRISRPIQKLTAGLIELSNGNLSARLPEVGNDEIGTAMRAFNRSALELQESRDRLVHFTRLSSWQTLARKMAHEVKNSLTPIRLTMEEIAARGNESDPRFLEQAAQIVVDEVGTLERRVRAFSEFAAEPPIEIGPVDVNALMEERVAFLRSSHPEVVYNVCLAEGEIKARADADLLKGVLTNLLENAAEAAGGGGKVLGRTFVAEGKVGIEVHDSGPGLSPHARGSLFEPTISFKKAGMGLGLSIARKSALLSGGDILLVEGELGGAAFRVLLPTG